ncbi:MAG: C39 family peptidase [Phycisphaerales bacterium JB060]
MEQSEPGTPMRSRLLNIDILPQPDDETCGPTCLHAVYRYWGDQRALASVIESVRSLNKAGAGRGTLAVMLGVHALSQGYAASLFTFNLQMFDPTWFDEHGEADPRLLGEKLAAQEAAKSYEDLRFPVATESYQEFLRLGGTIHFRDLTSEMVSGLISSGRPVLTGLSATYLYKCAREFGPNDDYDDVRGEPTGHFVVLHGYDEAARMVRVADPLADNPGFEVQGYDVPLARLVPAIMLGVLTYDANMLVIEPKSRGSRQGDRAS